MRQERDRAGSQSASVLVEAEVRVGSRLCKNPDVAVTERASVRLVKPSLFSNAINRKDQRLLSGFKAVAVSRNHFSPYRRNLTLQVLDFALSGSPLPRVTTDGPYRNFLPIGYRRERGDGYCDHVPATIFYSISRGRSHLFDRRRTGVYFKTGLCKAGHTARVNFCR